MSSSNSTDSSYARWTSQGSAIALTTCSLADLAAAARQAASAIGHDADQRYGTHKVFLAAVHAALGGEDAIDLEAFKRRMVSAHRAGLVVLARADLVAAMPQAAVAASEVSDGGAEFHFVLDDAARDPWADAPDKSGFLAGRVVAMLDHVCCPIARADDGEVGRMTLYRDPRRGSWPACSGGQTSARSTTRSSACRATLRRLSRRAALARRAKWLPSSGTRSR